MTRVFISYAHTDADTALARNLEKWLAAAGVEPWLDESRNWPGKNLEHAIPAAVEQSDAAIARLRLGRKLFFDPILSSEDRKSTRLNSSHVRLSRMPSSA